MGKGSGGCSQRQALIIIGSNSGTTSQQEELEQVLPISEEEKPVEEHETEIYQGTAEEDKSIEHQLLEIMGEDDDDDEDDENAVVTVKVDTDELKKDPKAWKAHLKKIKEEKALKAKKAREARDKLLAEVLENEGEEALQNMNPLALQAKLIPGTDINDPNIMLKPCVEVKMVTNPVFDAVLQKMGASRRNKRTYRFLAYKDTPPEKLLGFLKALPKEQTYTPSIWKEAELGKKGGSVSSPMGQVLTDIKAKTGIGQKLGFQLWKANSSMSNYYPESGKAHSALLVNVKDNEIGVKVMTQKEADSKGVKGKLQLYPGAADLHTMKEDGLNSGQTVTVLDALSMIGAAKAKKMRTVVDPIIYQLSSKLDDSVVIRSVPGSPGLAEIVKGKNVEDKTHSVDFVELQGDYGASKIVLPANEAVKAIEKLDNVQTQLIDDAVEDILVMQDPPEVDIDGLLPHQNEAVALHLATKKGYLNACEMGMGKGHPISTNILTPTGWRKLGDLEAGDYVIGSNGKPTKVLQVFDRGELDVFRVSFNDGSSVLCDADHVWNVTSTQKKSAGQPRKTANIDVRNLIDDLYIGKAKNLKWHIPVVQPVQFEDQGEKVIPAYTLGSLLGDGSFEDREIVLTSNDYEMIELIERDLELNKLTNNKIKIVQKHRTIASNGRLKTAQYRLSTTNSKEGNVIKTFLRENDLLGKKCNEKFIPQQYLISSAEERLDLLRGLFDTDGTHHITSGVEFATTSPQLAEDVKFLVQSLGGNVSIAERITNYVYNGQKKQGKISYRIYAKLDKSIMPFKLQRKIEKYNAPKMPIRRLMKSIVPEGRDQVRCIKVAASDELYVTEDFLVTHNTPMSLSGCSEKWLKAEQEDRGYRVLICAEKSLIKQWQDEAGRFFPDARTFIATGTNIVKLQKFLKEQEEAETPYPVAVLASYNIDKLLPLLKCYSWDDMIVDEAAVLKSTSSARSKALWEMREHVECAVALTGTPIDKGLDDIGAILSWVRNDTALFEGEKLSRRFNITSTDSMTNLNKEMGPVIFRRDQSEISNEIPKVVTKVFPLELKEPEIKLSVEARQLVKELLTNMEEQTQKEIVEALKNGDITAEEAEEAEDMLKSLRGKSLGAMAIARQAASDPVNVNRSESTSAMLLEDAGLVKPALKPKSKRKKVEEYVEKRVKDGKPALIFTEFIGSAESLKEGFEEKDMKVGIISGSMSTEARAEARKDFQGRPCKDHAKRPGSVKGCPDCETPKYDVMVLTKAANKGLNLQRAATLVHYDMSWMPSDYGQRVGRARRIGSENKEIESVIMLSKDTLEERVGAVLVPRAMQALMALDASRGVDISKNAYSGMAQEFSKNLGDKYINDDEESASIYKLAKEMILE